MSATVLIVDGGGRGAALVDKYAQSQHVKKILAVPGNNLMQINTKKPVKIYPHLKTTSLKAILEICQKEKVALVDVAQDNAVEAGLVNELNKINIKTVGPTREAGQIEWDKAWAREFMSKYAIPHPKYYIFRSEKAGQDFLKQQPDSRWFVKAYGLAEGKGALPAENNQEAIDKISAMQRFGNAGKIYLLEEWLEGEEFSTFAVVDGENFQVVGSAQDHKRVFNFDQGENTGGMGCSSPPLVLTSAILKEVKKIFQKTIEGLIKEKRPYQGVLYLGGILVKRNGRTKPFVIEFNARWGDPEAEVIIPAIKNDLFEISQAIAAGNIRKIKIQKDNLARVSVAATSKGYPDDYSSVKGKQIYGLEKIIKLTGVKIYGAGVKLIKGKYYASGGRLLHIVGTGKNVIEARQKAYMGASMLYIEGNNLHYRTDIGWRDVEKLRRFHSEF